MLHKPLTLLAAAALVAKVSAATPPQKKATTFAVYPAWDSYTGNYKTLTEVTTRQCEQVCISESSQCLGYTHMPDGGDVGTCWLKNQLSASEWQEGLPSTTSGVLGGCAWAAASGLVPSQAVQTCTNDLVCPENSVAFGGSCQCVNGFYGGGTNGDGSLKRCYPVCQPNFYPQLTNNGFATGTCVRCPAYSYSTGSQSSCSCDASIAPRLSTNAPGQTSACRCPVQSTLSANGKCECNAGWRSGGTTADGLLKFCLPVCQANFYPDIISQPFSVPGTCTRCPRYSSSTGLQTSCTCYADTPSLSTTPAGQTNQCSCPANASRATLGGVCSCNTGFYPRGTYPDGSLRTCLPQCPPNEYPILSGDGRPLGGCSPCPERSTSSGSTFECTCDAKTTRLETTPAGQTRKCSTCASPYVPSLDGRSCVLPPSVAETMRRKKRNVDTGLCPSGQEACSLGHDLVQSGYECVDLNEEFEHCGACGHNCLAIAGAADVACIAGQCTIASCQEGFTFVATGTGRCNPPSRLSRRGTKGVARK